MPAILRQGTSCDSVPLVAASGLLVDARDYYLAVHRAIASAEHFVLIAGWQFDSRVALLRGEDTATTDAPAGFLELLREVARARPNLRVYLLAWDYSVVFSLEREWMQKVKFDWTTGDQIRFVFDAQHPPAASHHQKLVVVDGAIAFAGGIDLCESRWDDRKHAPDNPDRVNRSGAACKPYHDLVAYCTGDAVADLAHLFALRWERATGESLALPSPGDRSSPELEGALPMPARELAISLTFGEHAPSRTPHVEQIKALFEAAIDAARRLIYIETQYFTSQAILMALCARMKAAPRGSLQVVVVMPMVGDTPKETFALGDTQTRVLAGLQATARECGQELRILCSVSENALGESVATFIHSKLLIVDDRMLSVGSANCTNRSMSFDSELNLSWEDEGDGELSAAIARVRGNLLCEHAGIEREPALERIEGLIVRLDALLDRSRLRLRPLPESPDEVPQQPWLELAFDPQCALTDLELDELLARA